MMVGKLLIVDDEISVRKGLSEAITSNFPHWRVVGEAANGAEAMEKIRLLEPHLVLTDIRMPAMDGMELARNVHQYHRDTAVIIFTAYKDFEYAQAAIRYGVREFLLKPCSEEEMVRVMQNAYDHLLEKSEKRENELLEKQLILENTVRSLMLRLPYDPHAIGEIEKDYSRKNLWFIKVLSFFPETKYDQPDDIGLLQFSLCNIMKELIGIHRPEAVTMPIFFDVFACFLEPVDSIADYVAEIQERSEQLLGITIEAANAGIVRQMNRLPALLDAFLQGRGETVRETAVYRIASNTVTDQFTISQTKIKSLQSRIMAKMMIGQMESLKESLESFIQSMKGLSPADAKNEALAFAFALNGIIRKEFSSNDEKFDLITQFEDLHRLEHIEEVIDWAGNRSEKFQLEYMKWLQCNNQNIIEKSVRYIEEHYMNDCSLTEVAAFVHLSPSYFSNMFKKEKGESFVNFLTKVRMEKAKVLLSNTGLKIFEVAHSVGYDDPNYFTAVFKHTQHLSPGEFRKMCQKER
ncbi:MAG: response regulator [Paenibacillus sp.]|jgi:two-component system response regulator YesN|nr:response regulator [Paenibacillus sp.]